MPARRHVATCLLLALPALQLACTEGDDEFFYVDATPADLENRLYGFGTDFFDSTDPRAGQLALVAIGDFDSDGDGDPDTAPISIVSADGSIQGGRLTVGSCIFDSTFLAFEGETPESDDTRETFACQIEVSHKWLLLTNADGEEDESGVPNVLGTQLEFENVVMSPSAEVPPVPGRPETGRFTLRLREGAILEYEFVIDNVSATDSLTNAHIHTGDSSVNGPVFITLVGGPVQFGRTEGKAFPTGASITLRGAIILSADEANTLRAAGTPIYVNVHSTNEGDGLLRAQLR